MRKRKKIDRTNEKTPVRCRVDQSTNQFVWVFREEKKRGRKKKKNLSCHRRMYGGEKREKMRETEREKRLLDRRSIGRRQI